MSQSTEIKMVVGLTTIEHVYGSRAMAEYFNLSLISGESVREINLDGDNFGYINTKLQAYLKEFPGDVVTKAIREILSAKFMEWNELHAGIDEDLETFELQFQVRLVN